MDKGKIKEDLSICYLKTIATINGIALERIEHDEDSIDVVIKKLIYLHNGGKFNSQISVQLKTTSSVSQYNIGNTEISYLLKAKNYNDLCAPASMPSMLALLILPENEDEWIAWNPEELMIKGKMFWVSFQGNEETKNVGNITVKIPKENVLNVTTISTLIEKVAEEGMI